MSSVITVIIALVVLYGLSWLLTCGLIYVAFLAFNWAHLYKILAIAPVHFSFRTATGIWIICCILMIIFGKSSFLKIKKIS